MVRFNPLTGLLPEVPQPEYLDELWTAPPSGYENTQLSDIYVNSNGSNGIVLVPLRTSKKAMEVKTIALMADSTGGTEINFAIYRVVEPIPARGNRVHLALEPASRFTAQWQDPLIWPTTKVIVEYQRTFPLKANAYYMLAINGPSFNYYTASAFDATIDPNGSSMFPSYFADKDYDGWPTTLQTAEQCATPIVVLRSVVGEALYNNLG